MAGPFFPLILAFCLGILLSASVQTQLPWLFSAVGICLLLTWISYARRRDNLAFWLSLLIFVGLGLLCPPMHQLGYGANHLRTLADSGRLDLTEPCRVVGICSKGSIPRGIGEQIELVVDSIENRFHTYATQGRVRLALYYQKGEAPPKQPLLAVGERVEILANLRLPKNFNNPGQFNYKAYLERQDVALVGTIKNELLIKRLAQGEGSFLSRQVYWMRERLLAQIEASFAGEQQKSPVMKALLLGDKQSLSPQIEEQFRSTGLYHLLVISGQHVAVMAALLFGLFRLVRLPKTLTIVFTMCGLWLYSAITEAQPSIVRATLMACVFLMVLRFDRDRDLLNSLSLAAGCLLWLDPFWLFDPGFQLSFLAVLTIALVALPLLGQTTVRWRRALWQIQDAAFDSHFEPQLADFRIWLRLKIDSLRSRLQLDRWNPCGALVFLFRMALRIAELFIVSISIQLIFVVLMLIYFHRVSLISPILNLVAVPLVDLLVPLGFLLLLFTLVHLPLQMLLTRCCGFLVHAFLRLAEIFSGTEWGNFRMPTPPVWLSVFYFVSLILALAPFSKRVRGTLGTLAAGALALMLAFPFPPRTPQGLLQMTFLDVRQGDSIFVSFPDQSNLVIDGGGLLGRSFGEHFGDESFDVGEQVVSPFLWSLGVRRLDALVLTHAHHDHMSGLEALLRNFEVGELWVGQNPPVPEYRNLLKQSLQKSVPIRTFVTGDWVDFHSTQMEFLNPVKGGRIARAPKNDDSLAFRLQFKDRKFLFTGDIERRVETEILERGRSLESDLLKVAHHGSKSSTLPEFLNRANPLWAVISVAENSPFGHPHMAVLELLRGHRISTFRTDRHGAITVKTDGKRMEVECYVADHSAGW